MKADVVRVIIDAVNNGAAGLARLWSGKGRPGESFTNREFFQQFGMGSRPPAGSEGIALVHGNIVYLIATDGRATRISLEDGETAIWNEAGDKVHLKADGEILVKTSGRVKIEGATEVNIEAPAVKITASGSAIIESPDVKIGVSGGHKALATEDLLTWATSHIHSGIQTGSGTSGTPVTPPVTQKTTNLKAT